MCFVFFHLSASRHTRFSVPIYSFPSPVCWLLSLFPWLRKTSLFKSTFSTKLYKRHSFVIVSFRQCLYKQAAALSPPLGPHSSSPVPVQMALQPHWNLYWETSLGQEQPSTSRSLFWDRTTTQVWTDATEGLVGSWWWGVVKMGVMPKSLSETSLIISFHVSVPSLAPGSRNRSSQWNESPSESSQLRWVWQEELSLQLHLLPLCTNSGSFPSLCFQPMPAPLWWAGSTCCSGWRLFPSPLLFSLRFFEPRWVDPVYPVARSVPGVWGEGNEEPGWRERPLWHRFLERIRGHPCRCDSSSGTGREASSETHRTHPDVSLLSLCQWQLFRYLQCCISLA